jgi:acetyl esterase/lipase
MRKFLIGLFSVAAIAVAAFLLSPWPSVWLIRQVFDSGAAKASSKLEKHVPPGIAQSTHRYDANDPDAQLDIIRPGRVAFGAPTIVWIHGGGFVSGRRQDLTNYLKVLAGRGFNVVNVDYTIAPEANYPTPIRQVQAALAFLTREGRRLGIDPGRIVLAGDSAGAQIAAQTAATIVDAGYARRSGISPGARPEQIAGTLLFCGVYDVTQMGKGGGIIGWFVGSTTWAYSGNRDGSGLETMSVAPNVTAAFPPAFISAGNADPLGPQSVAMAEALKSKGTDVTTLFFAKNHQPPLAHEYQFDLETADGRRALDEAVRWLNTLQE